MLIRPLESPRMIRHALAYARRGFAVLPVYPPFGSVCTCGNPDCDSIGKHPIESLVPHGSTDASMDAARVRRWWKKYPNANIGIRIPKGMIVVDADARKGGPAKLEALKKQNGDLITWRCMTGSGNGSSHDFLKIPSEGKLRGTLGEGLDIKTPDSYVVAVPSLHKSGKRYQWSPDSSRTLAEISPAWAKLVFSGSNGTGQKEKLDTASVLAGVPEGKRDDATWRLACKLRNADVPFDIALKLVLEAAANCTPAFSPKVAREKVERAFQRYQPSPEQPPPPSEDPDLIAQFGAGRRDGKGLSAPWEPQQPFEPKEYWGAFDVADIESWACPELEPVIEGILAKGNLCWLAAESQTGKTLFMLWICLQLLRRGSLFDKFPITPVKKILYLACEDPARRFKSRLLDMRPGAIERGRFVVYVSPGLSIADPDSFDFLEKMILEGGYDLAVLDTFQAATMGISSFDDEKLSVVIRRLLTITRKLGATIIVNDHFRKTQNHKKRADLDINDVKGSGGKIQNADVFLLMDRQDGQLRIFGRSKEWDKPIGLLVNVAPQGSHETEKFSFAGDLELFGVRSTQKGEASKQSILEAVEKSTGRISCGDIVKATHLSKATVRRHLTALVEAEKVLEEGEGRWTRYSSMDHSRK